jgi:monoamine oxidase
MPDNKNFDIVIVGSGFGGTLAATLLESTSWKRRGFCLFWTRILREISGRILRLAENEFGLCMQSSGQE